MIDGQPIGLVQYSHYADYPEYLDELAPLVDLPERAVSIDYLIGHPALTGRGISTAMIAAFVAHIWRTDSMASSIIVPVCSANEASWRALRKAGFSVVARTCGPTTRSTTRRTRSSASIAPPRNDLGVGCAVAVAGCAR